MEIDSLDTIRTNLDKFGSNGYTFSPYFPNLISTNEYLQYEHTSRLKILNYNSNIDSQFFADVLDEIKYGKYDELSKNLTLPPNIKLSSMDIKHFKDAYYNYIEPILIGYKRYEFYNLLKN